MPQAIFENPGPPPDEPLSPEVLTRIAVDSAITQHQLTEWGTVVNEAGTKPKPQKPANTQANPASTQAVAMPAKIVPEMAELDIWQAVLDAGNSVEAAYGIFFADEIDEFAEPEEKPWNEVFSWRSDKRDIPFVSGQTSYGGYRGLETDVPYGWEYVLWTESTGLSREEYWTNPNFIYSLGNDLHPTIQLSDYKKMSNYEFTTVEWQKQLAGALLAPLAQAVDHTTRYGRGFLGLAPLPDGVSRGEALKESFLGAYDVLTWGAVSDVRYGIKERDPVRVGFGIMGLWGLVPLTRGVDSVIRNSWRTMAGHEISEQLSLVGFRGTGSRELAAYGSEHGLVRAGHVGIEVSDPSISGVFGFWPSQDILKKFESEGFEVAELLKGGGAVPGAVQNDTEVFLRVNELLGQGISSELMEEDILQPLRLKIQTSPESYAQILDEVQFQLIHGTPSHTPVYYKWPSREGIPMESWCNNCATYFRQLGVEIPETTGQMGTYMKAMRDLGAEPWAGLNPIPQTLPSVSQNVKEYLVATVVSRLMNSGIDTSED